MAPARTRRSARASLRRAALAGCGLLVVMLPFAAAHAGRCAAAAAGLTALGAVPAPAAFAPSALLGPAGYLLTLPAAAYALRSLGARPATRSDARALAAFVTGAGLLFVSGVMWLTAVDHASPPAAVGLALLPFMAGDALRCGATALLAPVRPVIAARLRA